MQEGGKPAEAYGFCSEVRKILKVLGLEDLHRAGFTILWRLFASRSIGWTQVLGSAGQEGRAQIA